MISTKRRDDVVGQARKLDDFQQKPEQAAVLGKSGGESGQSEPKGEWGKTGDVGRPPVAIGGNSQGQGDRMPAGGGSVSNAPATNSKTLPGDTHEA